ncbi:MAG: serine/threonine-protein phosphatase [Acidobacteria bacterium]|nr:serine/threonine-protein phosphatase [Acidobacteriota bacterium]
MSQPEFDGRWPARGAVEIQDDSPPRSSADSRARNRDLELKLSALQKDYAELHTALFEAAQGYRRLCAPRLVRHGDVEIASEIFAVRHLPGDFFTVAETNAGLVLALGDICGKGLAAGMWTTLLAGLVGTHTAANPEPEAILAGVNRDLCRMSPSAPLTSLFLARLDPDTGRLDYSSAGHPPALLLRAHGRLEWLAEGGPLLGAFCTSAFTGGDVRIGEGDILLACSDGILESQNDVEEEFGYERLEAELRRSQTGSAETVMFSVLGAVQDFACSRPLADDTSLMVLRCGTRSDRINNLPG